ncbi:FGGY-family carbohydrate kinase [Chitinophaga qingshengii]|uniref:FGGY-family carbohydrate kinase n=1 Tax=Chitinophaga qingshengii TaxID=1569794 RepID=A0ABR7TLC7_9BACT|nr:FGGY-family carbohydrate kinase [Chitinophaga qingshengii]MBC9929859.1 FGGY-family carbohydrate kinase [Chitinophaga qingshengii]
MQACFIGIDIGTQGARVVLMDQHGQLRGSREKTFPLQAGLRQEQSPLHWWDACQSSLQALLQDDAVKPWLPFIRAMAVTSTSGTIIPIDHRHVPLHPAIMYSDTRQTAAAQQCREAAIRYNPNGYTAFNTSSGLPKMVWFVQQYPEKAAQLYKFIHAADYLSGRLCGRFDITDPTCALKSGYDIHHLRWPAYLWEQLPLQASWLPEVVPSGTPIGTLLPELAQQWGLSPEVAIVAGITDGCASQIAAGAVRPGDWNTTIGTTLVVKGVTTQPIRDPGGALYNHLHPQGYSMPGGASNTGADWITQQFPGADLAALNAQALERIPTRQLSWPLLQEGERFPFVSPQARGFAPDGLSTVDQYAAGMEGVAFIERYAYEKIAQLSGEAVQKIYTAGGASNSHTWLTIRSNVLQLPVIRMKHTSGAAGAAMLAASRTWYHHLTEAVSSMAQEDIQVQPTPALSRAYEAQYRRFLELLKEKGYISTYEHA